MALIRYPTLLLVLTRTLTASPPEVRTEPARILNGTAFVVRVAAQPEWTALGGEIDGRAVVFDREEDGSWSALGGVDFDAKPGRHDLRLRASTTSGPEQALVFPLTVEHAERPTSRLTVAKKFIEPDAKTRARIERERALKAQLLSVITAERIASGSFAPPMTLPTSEGYGVERLFNGKRQSVHLGLDFRAPTGTPVAAVNAGRVVLARDLFYEGRCVAVDHGRGLVTLYLHLSRIDVKEGAAVARGERLGVSGASGRVTGPHLHLAVRWRGIYLDPVSLLALDLR